MYKMVIYGIPDYTCKAVFAPFIYKNITIFLNFFDMSMYPSLRAGRIR